MCVILHRKYETFVDDADIIDAYHTNPDGYGLMYQNKGKVITEKGIIGLDELLDKLNNLCETEYILHLRIRTHGKINKQNCHPFSIGFGGYLMHNGMLDVPIFNENMSDTWHFSNIIRGLGRKLSLKDYSAIEEYHDSFNRMAFMYPDSIEKTGSWYEHRGNEWSNLNWQYQPMKSYEYSYVDHAWSEQWNDCKEDYDSWYYKD